MPKKLTIVQMHDLAASRGGKCLSTTYKNNRTKLEWQCSEGHTWKATPHSVKTGGTWCPECPRNKKKKK